MARPALTDDPKIAALVEKTAVTARKEETKRILAEFKDFLANASANVDPASKKILVAAAKEFVATVKAI